MVTAWSSQPIIVHLRCQTLVDIGVRQYHRTGFTVKPGFFAVRLEPLQRLVRRTPAAPSSVPDDRP